MGSTDTGLGGDTDAAEARRIEARRAVAKRKQLAIRAARLVDVEAARQLARERRDAALAGAGMVASPEEEMDGIGAAILWHAAETRAQRIEDADRKAMVQETGSPFRTATELEDAAERARAAEDAG